MRVPSLTITLLFAAAAAAADQTVDVGPGLAFTPSTVIVAPGETVTWVWLGSPHSSTSNATSGPEFWDSGILSTGDNFSHTFNTPGTYPYYCKVHSSPTGTAMNGIVQVVAPTATPVPTISTPPAGTPTPSIAAVPALDPPGRVVLLIGLAALGLWLLARNR